MNPAGQHYIYALKKTGTAKAAPVNPCSPKNSVYLFFLSRKMVKFLEMVKLQRNSPLPQLLKVSDIKRFSNKSVALVKFR